jgi:hypothetical protein
MYKFLTSLDFDFENKLSIGAELGSDSEPQNITNKLLDLVNSLYSEHFEQLN